MEFDKEIKAKNILDEYMVCHFGEGHKAPFYLKDDFWFTSNFESQHVLRFRTEVEAQEVCASRNEEFKEDGHPLAGKLRVCRIALQLMPVRDVAGEGESAHFTPRKKLSTICPAQFDQVSPEDLVDDFPAPLSDDPDVDSEFGCREE